MKYEVSEQKCSGHGQCYAFYPELFREDEIGFNADRGRGPLEVPAGLEKSARRGVRICPEGAISVKSEGGSISVSSASAGTSADAAPATSAGATPVTNARATPVTSA